MRIILALIGIVAALAFAGYGAWYVPASHPDIQRLGELQKARGPAPHELDVECSRDDELCRASYVETRKNAAPSTNWTLFLSVTDPIPNEDCQLMAQVLRDEAGLVDDGGLINNADGGMNCDFARYGLAHKASPERPEGYVIRTRSTGLEQTVPRAVYEYAVREDYVTRPVYSLFRTRASIEYGGAQSGRYCVYNRFKGTWRREGECRQAWVV